MSSAKVKTDCWWRINDVMRSQIIIEWKKYYFSDCMKTTDDLLAIIWSIVDWF